MGYDRVPQDASAAPGAPYGQAAPQGAPQAGYAPQPYAPSYQKSVQHGQGGYAAPAPHQAGGAAPQQSASPYIASPYGGGGGAANASLLAGDYSYQQGRLEVLTNPEAQAGPKYNDWPFAILFVLHLFGMIALCAIKVRAASKAGAFGTSGERETLGHALGDMFRLTGVQIALGTLAGGILFGLLWIQVMKSMPLLIVKIALGFSAAFPFILAVLFFAVGQPIAGVIMIVWGLIICLWVFLIRKRIPLAAAMLHLVTSVVKQHPAMIGVTFGSLFPMAVWLMVIALGMYAVVSMDLTDRGNEGGDPYYDEDNNDAGISYGAWGLTVLLAFSWFWAMQVVRAVVHVTCSGSFASWYFLSGTNPVPNPTVGSLKRACSYSFGSVCLGALIVAIVQTLRYILRSVRRSRNAFARACALCFLNILERLIRYFNRYAYVYVALYGTTFVQSGKRVWALIKDRGFSAVINDDIIGGVLFLGALAGGAVLFGVGSLWAWQAGDLEWWLGGIIGFFMGFVCTLLVQGPIFSCVAAAFVCLAEDPVALQTADPQHFAEISAAWAIRYGELVPTRA